MKIFKFQCNIFYVNINEIIHIFYIYYIHIGIFNEYFCLCNSIRPTYTAITSSSGLSAKSWLKAEFAIDGGLGGLIPPVPLFIPLLTPQSPSSCWVANPPNSFFTIWTLVKSKCYLKWDIVWRPSSNPAVFFEHYLQLMSTRHWIINWPSPRSSSHHQAVVYPWECWSKFLVTGCPSSHQPTRIREETLECGNLFEQR